MQRHTMFQESKPMAPIITAAESGDAGLRSEERFYRESGIRPISSSM